MLNPSMLTESDRLALEAVLAQSPADVSEEDAAILRARRDYLTEEQKAVFADALAATTETPAETPAEDEKPQKKGK
jgi:hypothetical protein